MDEVIGVEYSEDLSQFELNLDTAGEAVHKLASCVPMSMFKFYLYRILQQDNRRSRSGSGARGEMEQDLGQSLLFFFKKKEVSGAFLIITSC